MSNLKKPIAVLTDSTSDLSPELLKKYDITVFPLHINLGNEDHLDGVDVTPDEIYRWSDEHKQTPKTAALSPAEAESILVAALEKAEQVIVFCVSGEMSGCYQILNMATQSLEKEDRVFVIDSRNLSTGIGLQILEAAEMAQNGISAKEIVAHIEAISPYVRASFVVDTLTYLHRGGRCSGVAAFAGSALQLHPYIFVKDGKMSAGKKYRGSMERVFGHYVEDLKPVLLNAHPQRVFITHSGCSEEIIQAVKEQVESLGYFQEILITRAGSVISSHCGPGTLGVLFIEKAGE